MKFSTLVLAVYGINLTQIIAFPVGKQFCFFRKAILEVE